MNRHRLTYGALTVFIIALGLLSRTACITNLLPGMITAYLGDALWAAIFYRIRFYISKHPDGNSRYPEPLVLLSD
ncbi:hypothetical protein DALLNEIH_01520 [Bacillus sp. B01(2024)]